MAIQHLDALGLKCPQPVLKIAVLAPEMQPGDILEVAGDCLSFESDVRAWCFRLNKTILVVREEEGSRKIIQIRF